MICKPARHRCGGKRGEWLACLRDRAEARPVQ
jgi:hypothetical protein